MTWPALLEVWPLVESAFHSEYGVDLEDVWLQKSGRWFKSRLVGLLSTDTALAGHFRPPPATPPPPPVT